MEDGSEYGRVWPMDKVMFSVSGFPSKFGCFTSFEYGSDASEVTGNGNEQTVRGSLGPIWMVEAGDTLSIKRKRNLGSQLNGICTGMGSAREWRQRWCTTYIEETALKNAHRRELIMEGEGGEEVIVKHEWKLLRCSL